MSESLTDPQAEIEALEAEVANLRQQLNREVVAFTDSISKLRLEYEAERKGIVERLDRFEALWVQQHGRKVKCFVCKGSGECPSDGGNCYVCAGTGYERVFDGKLPKPKKKKRKKKVKDGD